MTSEFANSRFIDATHGEVTHERTPKVMHGASPDARPLDERLEVAPHVVPPEPTLVCLEDELALLRELPS